MVMYFDTIQNKNDDLIQILHNHSTKRFSDTENVRFSRLSEKDKKDPKNAIKIGKINDYYYWGYGDKLIFGLTGNEKDVSEVIDLITKNVGNISIRSTPYIQVQEGE